MVSHPSALGAHNSCTYQCFAQAPVALCLSPFLGAAPCLAGWHPTTLQVTGNPHPQELSQPMTVRSWWVNSLASLGPGSDNSETCPTQSPKGLSRIEPQMPTAVSGYHMEYMWVYDSCEWCACECVWLWYMWAYMVLV